MLLALQRDTGTAIMLITHDLLSVADIAHEVAVLYAGRCIEKGTVEQVLGRPQHPYAIRLLASVPQLLGRRFEQLHQAHRSALPAGAADDPARWLQPGAWLHTFCQDMRAVLLAELELRLQPVAGLLDALNEVTRQP